jgi:ABC-2 type transport system ATP-binding protein
VSSVALAGVFSPPLNGTSIELDAGLHVVLGTELDGTAELVALVAGVAAPRRGRVSVAGQDPRSTPALRRRIGALLATEELPPGTTVSAALGLSLRARADRRGADELLASAGLPKWGPRRTDSLSTTDRRRIALALALSITDRAVLALHEPLVAAASERARVREQIAERAAAGACVLATTASPRDADDLGGTLLLLERGRFVRRPGEPLATELSPGTPPVLRVRTADPRRLAAELAGDPALTRLEYSAGPESELCVHGPDPDALALAVARAARRAQVPVLGIACVLPRLEIVRAASEGLTRAALESAQRAAYEAAQRPVPRAAEQPPPNPPPEQGS